MRVLFDQGTPVPLRRHLPGHDVETAYERGRAELHNGELLREAEEAGLTVLITTDQNLRYQQDLASRSIAVLVLLSTSWPKIQSSVSDIAAAVDTIERGDYREIPIG